MLSLTLLHPTLLVTQTTQVPVIPPVIPVQSLLEIYTAKHGHNLAKLPVKRVKKITEWKPFSLCPMTFSLKRPFIQICYCTVFHTLHDPVPPYTVELEASLLHVPVTSHDGHIFLGWQQQSHSGEIHFSGEIHWLGTARSSMVVVVIKYPGTSNILKVFCA